MSLVNTHINPLTTDGMLAHLGQAIEEVKLLRSIGSLREQLYLSDILQQDAGRRQYLVAELRYLDKRLVSLRKQVCVAACRHGLDARSQRAI